ncbi:MULTISPECIES: hypothetical protein [unclassified Bradyrhizobium]|uniref:hypothetical protein n=1 Tax=unclassified Bradyrhizobium TaxID=2631580 RepID=UPI002478B7E2|nr:MULTISPECIES: hypothetical protein [unclassified Bradyrhizobium]WGR72740.1 hypothetical protein MTX24_07460 [Bradyrhizobium sp. ISRA426]WGR77574.1 hypothetical protein MTX21_32410 [Bradyrhizobium sp. ISRA430]WGR87980.1 hypothetical protein MTX25_07460 [Bradyrhizobium sp. ISRA432]
MTLEPPSEELDDRAVNRALCSAMDDRLAALTDASPQHLFRPEAGRCVPPLLIYRLLNRYRLSREPNEAGTIAEPALRLQTKPVAIPIGSNVKPATQRPQIWPTLRSIHVKTRLQRQMRNNEHVLINAFAPNRP